MRHSHGEGRAWARPSFFPAAVLLGLLLAGCGDAEDGATGDWGACANTHCAAALEQCRRNPECQLVFDCMRSCSPADLSCQGGCKTRFPAGLAAADALSDCLTRNCVDSR